MESGKEKTPVSYKRCSWWCDHITAFFC